MSEAKVDRCECVNRTFEELKEFKTLEMAQASTGCGQECEGCLPYLQLMFASGETAIDLDDPRLSDYN
ncbi:MAG: hypothetical protein D6703_02115 [Zetaproteobacteria bacterium]|nr:MAG: hypothetical protein D6703_02115 [Zetaproteobacteria bacterium]